MADTAQRWQAVGRHLRDRMKQLGGMLQKDLIERSGYSSTTVRYYTQGVEAPYNEATRAAICAAVGWTPDSIDRILAGKAPRVAAGWEQPDGVGAPTVSRRLEALERRLERLEYLEQLLGRERRERLERLLDDEQEEPPSGEPPTGR